MKPECAAVADEHNKSLEAYIVHLNDDIVVRIILCAYHAFWMKEAGYAMKVEA